VIGSGSVKAVDDPIEVGVVDHLEQKIHTKISIQYI
jgi:hypothetical protein